MKQFLKAGGVAVCFTALLSQLVQAAPVSTPAVADFGVVRQGQPEPSQRTESVIFGSDFESGWDGWTTADITAAPATWHPSVFQGYGGHFSWWSGSEALQGYDNSWLQYLETPAIAIAHLPAILSFRLRYSTEDPAGATAPYNGWDGCNVWVKVDDGAWTVETGFSLAYDRTSLYSFGDIFNMGPNIPGWAGTRNWTVVTKDLAAYVGHTVSFRFAFCSDGAYCSIDEPAIIGMQVDDVSITADGAVVMENNAEDIAVPSNFVAYAGGEVAGDTWELSTASSHSPTHSAHASIGNGVNCALVSPVYNLPTGMDLWLEFWVRCDMLDFDGNNDNSLEDMYNVEVSTDGIVWTRFFYDYGDATRPGGTAWEDYIPGMPFNNNIEMSLNAYAGGNLQIRWRMECDGNDDGGIGTGLWIDDVEIWASDVPVNDLACTQIIPSYPRTWGAECPTYLQYANQGSEPRLETRAWVYANDLLAGPVTPLMDINPLSTITRTFNWTPNMVGENELKSYCDNEEDQLPLNDTLWVSPIDVRPASEYEFRYSYYDFTGEFTFYYFDSGDPAMLVTDVSRLNLTSYEIQTITLGLYDDQNDNIPSTGKTVRLHVMENNNGVPGEEIWNGDYTLPGQGQIAFWEFDVEAGVVVDDDFWIWAELVDNYPVAVGQVAVWNFGHYALTTDGSVFNLAFSQGANARELALWVVGEGFTSIDDVPSRPEVFTLESAFPNPFNPSTQMNFRAPAGSKVELNIYNLQGQQVATLFSGQATGHMQQATFDGGSMASAVYFARLEGAGRAATQKIVLAK